MSTFFKCLIADEMCLQIYILDNIHNVDFSKINLRLRVYEQMWLNLSRDSNIPLFDFPLG